MCAKEKYIIIYVKPDGKYLGVSPHWFNSLKEAEDVVKYLEVDNVSPNKHIIEKVKL